MLSIKPLGDQAIVITFSDQISPATTQQIRALQDYLLNETDLPIRECVPAYTTLSIYYDPMKIRYSSLVKEVEKIEFKNLKKDNTQSKEIEIPTLYGGDVGPDLEYVAQYHQLRPEEVIEIHSSTTYLIYMIGFAPGFPYLGGMSERIATPRLSKPRPKVTAGSIGIAGIQTGIYSVDSPGGWQIIGRTPLPLYQPQAEKPMLLHAGDYIRFIPISAEKYRMLIQESGQ